MRIWQLAAYSSCMESQGAAPPCEVCRAKLPDAHPEWIKAELSRLKEKRKRKNGH